MELHEYLKYYRELNHLTQEQLAERLYVSRQAVSKWERGESMPEIENIVRLSDLYNVSIDELLRGAKFLRKPFVIGEEHPKRGLVFTLIISLFMGTLGAASGYLIVGIIPFLILFVVGVSITKTGRIVVERNQIEIYDYKNWFSKLISFVSDKASKRVVSYEDIQSLRVIYQARVRVSPWDFGPDNFMIAFKLKDGSVYEQEPTKRIVENLPILSDFLENEGVFIDDPHDIVGMIIRQENIFEEMQKTLLNKNKETV